MNDRPIAIVLASTSPYRRDLLARLGLRFEVDPPDVDESIGAGEAPATAALRLAAAKARAVAARRPDALVIASDQTAEVDGELLRKPGGADANVAQLMRCSGRRVRFHTALCTIADGREEQALVPFDVHFRRLQREWVEWYVAAERPWDCAGGFRAEGVGIALFERLEGEDPSALIGLPLIRLSEMLRSAGVEVLGAGAAVAHRDQGDPA